MTTPPVNPEELKRDKIFSVIKNDPKLKIFEIINVDENTIELIPDKNTKDKKVILWEPSYLFNDASKLARYTEFLTNQAYMNVPKANILRIPYFSGINEKELSQFFFNKIDSPIQSFEFRINFYTLPLVNFNIFGTIRFLRYFGFLFDRYPVYQGCNNYNDYVQYFKKQFDFYRYNYAMVFPQEYLKLVKNSGVVELYRVLEEYKKERAGNDNSK